MLSRRTTLVLAGLLETCFHRYFSDSSSGYSYYKMKSPKLYDFLFENNYPAWFCNLARECAESCSSDTRPFIDFVLKIHTGESVYSATQDWTWPHREELGQTLLRDLAEDITKWLKDITHQGSRERDTLTRFHQSLELDGYVFRGDALLVPEEDVFDVKEEGGVLRDLYRELQLPNQDTVFHHLTLSEEHYLAKRWDDSISNSRKFLEGVLQEVAASHYLASQGSAMAEEIYTRPVRVREYLESSGLLESKEKDALASLYGLMSQTGGHPYMAQSEQARLLRHLALTFSQFVLLRLKGFKTSNRQ
jgi:hypothetical protein